MRKSAATGRIGSSPEPAVDAAGWLSLAAAPTFALMALLSEVGPPVMAMCSAASAFVPVNDMGLMYLLMSLFHVPPWLRLFLTLSHRNPQTAGD